MEHYFLSAIWRQQNDKGKEYVRYFVSSVDIKQDIIQILNTIRIINTENTNAKILF